MQDLFKAEIINKKTNKVITNEQWDEKRKF